LPIFDKILSVDMVFFDKLRKEEDIIKTKKYIL
jgi:hypothetical protein